jgi:hypothetical protein
VTKQKPDYPNGGGGNLLTAAEILKVKKLFP